MTPPVLIPLLPWEEIEDLRADPSNPDTQVRTIRNTITVLGTDGASWLDLGCNATDDVDGDLTQKVGLIMGMGRVSMSCMLGEN